jgi:hypothetical protein
MKRIRAEYSLCEIPELEEAEFDYSVSSHQRFEDANDFGHMGDSISISMDLGDA